MTKYFQRTVSFKVLFRNFDANKLILKFKY